MNEPKFKVGDRVLCVNNHALATVVRGPVDYQFEEERCIDYCVRWDTDSWLGGVNYNRSYLSEDELLPAPDLERGRQIMAAAFA